VNSGAADGIWFTLILAATILVGVMWATRRG
jgi:hypothetical protein